VVSFGGVRVPANGDESSSGTSGRALTIAGERRQLEDASNRFVSFSRDLLAIISYDGCLKWVNPAYEDLTGIPQEELVGRRYHELIHPGDRGRLLAEEAMLEDSGRTVTDFEARVRCHDGSYRWFLFTDTPSPDERLIYSVGKDVTDRRYDEQAVREAEERFRAAFEQAPIGMAMVSLEQDRLGCFLRVNHSLSDITGYPADELVGADFQKIVHADESGTDFHYARWLLAGEIPQYEVEKRLRHADGRTVFALVTVSLVKDVDARPLYFISQIQDITARKEAERAFAESRGHLQAIIDNTTAVIYVKDHDGRFLFVNDRFELLFGVKRDEVVGRTDQEVFPREIADASRANDLEVLTTGISIESEEVASGEDGPHVYLATRFPLFRPTEPDGAPYAVCTIATDITDRKRAEEAIRASEAHLRRMVNSAPMAFVSADADALITTWNPQAEKTFGWSESEALGRNLMRLLMPSRHRDRYRDALDEFLSTGKSPLLERRVEIEALHKEGHEFPIEIAITPVRVEGEYVFNAFINDVSERRRAEESIRQLANIVESSGDSIIGITPERVISSWNPGASAIYGYSTEEAIGRSLDALIPKQRRETERNVFARVLNGHEISHYETERIRKDGSIVDVAISLSPIKNAVGEVVGVSSISRDITERKRAEEALREVQEGFRTAVENAPIGVALVSTDTDEAGRLLEVNKALGEMTGYSTSELLATSLLAITHPDDRVAEQPLLEQLLEGKLPNYRLEKRYLRADGEIVWAMHNASTVRDSSGKLIYVIAQVEDITQRKRAEERLAKLAAELEERAVELERSNADLQQFAYAASHDLSEPLRTVTSYVQLLRKRYADKLETDANEFIDFAVDGAARMQALIDGLLLYSRAGTSEYAMAAVDCSDVVRATLATLDTAIRETGASVTFDALPTVRGDETQLSQLFQNLISNGIKFVAGKPPRVHISAARSDREWVFSVSDNGIGIKPEHAARIFTVFQRLHGRDDYPGSGVGLAICKRIVERHRGRIWVERNPEGGSTFRFTIPADGAEADGS
jgi:PAS domain S-box-containing protein